MECEEEDMVIAVEEVEWSGEGLACYFISGTLTHSLGTAIHEIRHNLAFGHHYGPANRILSLICSVPMIVVPVSFSYKKYHHDHHR